MESHIHTDDFYTELGSAITGKLSSSDEAQEPALDLIR